MKPVTTRQNTLDIWRQNLNTVANNVGDPDSIYLTDGSDNFAKPSTDQVVAALNDLNTRKVKRSGDTIANLIVTGTFTGSTGSFTGQVTSTLATGTAPFVVASTTQVNNLNASYLIGGTWAVPGTIGSTTPNSGAFTTLSATGQITSTLTTGTAPFVVASTTQVNNLNASQLIGGTWAVPGAIGSTTKNTGAFTTLSATGQFTSTVATGTAPFVVASTTQVTNLNASLLVGATWVSPGTIGSTAPNSGAFTTLSATGQFTSTVASGTAPFVVASTTQVLNLNASQLVGATWVSPGTIGSTTPNSGAFTTLSASGNLAIAVNKFTVDSTTGNTVAAGSISGASLTITGTSTLGVTTATTPTVDSNNTNVATTAYVNGQGSVTLPSMNGTATIGTSTRWAHGDHIHPTDTSRAPLANPGFTGTVGLNSITDVQTSTLTTTSTTAGQVILSVPIATYRSAEYIVQAVDSTGTKYHSVTVKAVHDGTNVSSVEYAAAVTANGICGTFTVDVNTGNLRLLTTPASANSTVFKVTAILTKV